MKISWESSKMEINKSLRKMKNFLCKKIIEHEEIKQNEIKMFSC